MKNLAFALCLVSMTLISSCTNQSTSSPNNIFEEDQRVSVEPDAYPLNAMGRLATDDGKWCTAFLIAPNIAMTNAHCVTTSVNELTFYKQYKNGDYTEEAGIIELRKGTPRNDNRISDWAVLVLDHDIATSNQWFDINDNITYTLINQASEDEARTSDTEGPYSMAGYPKDREDGHDLVWEQGCDVFGRNANWNYLYHDCDNKTGQSGSPIYYLDNAGRAQVVAINSAERFEDNNTRTLPEDGSAYRHKIANLATAPNQFAHVAEQLIADFPAGTDRRTDSRGIMVCNETSMRISAAFAYKEPNNDGRETVSGWYHVPADRCDYIDLNAVGSIYGFAFHWGNSRPTLEEGWPVHRDREFCVDTQNGFFLDSSRSCRMNLDGYLFQPFGSLDGVLRDNEWHIEPRL